MMFFSFSLPNVKSFNCISINNQEYKVRPQIVIVNSKESVFFPFSINAAVVAIISIIHMQNCVFLMLFKNLNVEVFNLISRTNKTRHIEWLETCKCKFRLDGSVCNNKQRWNDDKYRCECKELIGKGLCDKGFIWNPSDCDCECDKSCDVVEYLDDDTCKSKKKLVDKLVEECIETA